MANPAKTPEPDSATATLPELPLGAEAQAPDTPPSPDPEISAPRGFVPYQSPDGRWITHPQQGPWNVARAHRVMIFEDDSQPRIVKLELGTLPPIEVVRGFEVIIPEDALSVLRDKMHPQIKCDMNVSPPRRYEAMQTDAKYSVLGTATWSEYIAFRDAQRAKEPPKVNRRPII